ncbi:hypothetical protein M501DRAFT_988841 [Patellaria atrata CBS 101060]|uniref:Uncharacterized protein n=1 Tax=Patellaria atrata CBS 101060 TaxID=1346257 RepID=A0A9P4S3T2_9PEZI|nr:hypothetical protein M501DRAFT_988841 [Patellaria atrata CBS 101060]
MTRIFPSPLEGQHAAYPPVPSPLPARLDNILIPLIGTVGGLFRLLVSRQVGPSLTTAGTCTLWATITQVGLNTGQRWVEQPMLDALKIKPRRRSWIELNDQVELDDYIVVGACGGMAMAFLRRKHRPMNFTRYLGAAAMGGFFAFHVGFYRMSDTAGSAWRTFMETQGQATQFKVKLRKKYFAEAQERKAAAGSPTPLEQLFSMLKGSDKDTSQPGVPSHGTVAVFEELQEYGQQSQPGAAPHVYIIDENEKRKWVPTTDYHWEPRSPQEGLQELQGHIVELTDLRKQLVEETEYLWIELARREQIFYREKDESIRRGQRKELELLGSMHFNLWAEISLLDWMIADSRKNMLQLQPAKEGKKWGWMPQVPKHIESGQYKPLRTYQTLQRHLQEKESELEEMKASRDPRVPDHMREQLLDSARENVEATARLVAEFARLVDGSSKIGDKESGGEDENQND